MKKLDVSRLEEAVGKRIEADLAAGRVSCAGVLVRQKNGGVFERYYGSKTVDGKEKADEKTLFRLASMTKPVSAVCAMMLVDEGLIELDAPVEKYLPEFSRLRLGEVDENGNEIWSRPLRRKPTVRHLLRHTSLIDYGETFQRQYKNISPAQLASLDGSVEFYSSLILAGEPGTRHSYSGIVAFDVLAAIISRLSGVPFDRFVRERITGPLDMTDTVFAPDADQWARIAQMHDLKDGKAVKGSVCEGCVFENIPISHPLAGAGLIGSARDYDRFARMLLDGTFEGRRFISPEALGSMTEPECPVIRGSSHCWGLGVRVVDGASDVSVSRLPVGCFGWSGAYGTHFWVDPENGITAVFMRNSRFDGGSDSLIAANFERDAASALK